MNTSKIAPTYTVLTPTFNRAHTLHRAYESLQRQTMHGFEWIVVDDGSTDNTPELLASWEHEASFPITWCRYGVNRGRNAAVNSGIELTRGEYILTLDSDDELLDDAILKIDHWRLKTGIDMDENISELRFRYVYAHDENIIVGSHIGDEGTRGGGQVLRYSKKDAYRLKLGFDMLSVVKTQIRKTYRFTELDSSEHCPEGLTHKKVLSDYDSVLVNIVIGRVYCHEADGEAHLSDGYKLIKFPRGSYLSMLATLNNDIECLKENPGHFLKCAQKITSLGFLIGRSFVRQYDDLSNRPARMLWMAVMWYGLLSYVRYRLGGINAIKAHPDRSAWGPAAPPVNWELHSELAPHR